MATLSEQARVAIRAHAEATYPDECVGLLLGTDGTNGRQIQIAYPVPNRWSGQVRLGEADDAESRRDRFYLDPADYLRADRAARQQGIDVVGCYHSHPDHQAEPSERDRVGAQAIAGPSFSFLIQSVRGGQAAEARSWQLVADGSHFVEEPLAR